MNAVSLNGYHKNLGPLIIDIFFHIFFMDGPFDTYMFVCEVFQTLWCLWCRRIVSQ